MYINIKYTAQSNKKNRWIAISDNYSVSDVETLVNTLRCVPEVEEVYVNVKDYNNAKKTDNTPE